MISYLAENVNCGIFKQNPVEVFFVQSSNMLWLFLPGYVFPAAVIICLEVTKKSIEEAKSTVFICRI